MISKEALEKLSYIPIYEEDIDIIFKGDLCEVYRNEVDIISKDLDRLEKLEKENQELKEKCRMLEENEEAVLTTLEISVKENTRLKEVIEVIKNSSKLDCTNMFDNCKLTPLPELEVLENDK